MHTKEDIEAAEKFANSVGGIGPGYRNDLYTAYLTGLARKRDEVNELLVDAQQALRYETMGDCYKAIGLRLKKYLGTK